MKIVIDKDIPFLHGVLERFGHVVYLDGASISRNDLLDADALLIRTRTRCTAELLEKTWIKFIGSATIGHDHIDTAYCERQGIVWTTAPGCNAGAVQQYIAAALIRSAERHSLSLHDTTIGVVGVGNVGKKIVGLCRLLGMRVLCNDPPRVRQEGVTGFISLDTLMAESDIISLHVPLTTTGADLTYHLLDGKRLAGLKKDQIVINTSRGEVVDETSLKNVLRSGIPERAVIDVWTGEPRIDRNLLSLAGIATPHIAGYSIEGKANGTSMIVRALGRHFGFELDDWYPAALPEPAINTIEIDCRSKSSVDIIAAVIKQTYDILSDNMRLRAEPEKFELQRASYPVRREYSWYTTRLLHDDREIAMLLRSLGFTIELQ